jgi:ATP-dependent helicase/nuclease subunit A
MGKRGRVIMLDDVKPLNELKPDQKAAVIPDRDVWLSASAGSGKTQVLSARVIRLLLEDGVMPENLLCLTFTKAAAAEMAERINVRLASWVQATDPVLAGDLTAIGADIGGDTRSRARQLFARVLDAPGGGLQIMTIHSFCQSLLASFPEEAGLVPGFEPIEGRTQSDLLDETLSEMLVHAESRAQDWLIADLQQMSTELGEDGVQSFLKRCAGNAAKLLDFVKSNQDALVVAKKLVDIDFVGSAIDEVARRCSATVIDESELISLAEMNDAWGRAKGLKRAADIRAWLALDDPERAERLADLHYCFAKKTDGEVQNETKGQVPQIDGYAHMALDAYQWTRDILWFKVQAEYAERLGRAFRVGRAFAEAYLAAKHARGVVDFDDMIRNAATLLTKPGISEWVRYKLDRRIDHILIDESQDTNKAQWDIIEALADEYYSGSGAAPDDRPRTIFTVGDYKQAIYGFQGTDPEQYRQANIRFREKIENAGGTLHQLTLAQSFRSTRPILDFVNAVIDVATPAAFGIDGEIPLHYSELPDCGSVELLHYVKIDKPSDDDGEVDEDTAEKAEEDWLSEEKLKLARLIAHKVKALIDDAPILATTKKPLVPGDIMILMRNRGALADLIVARLHAAGVPVAGIDRMNLQDALAVQDLISCIRFVLQPEDDLSLANILVSPLVGWSQEKLLQYGYREKGHGLWGHLRDQDTVAGDIAPLRELLNLADVVTPFKFIEAILSGPMRGRQKLLARLGNETLVPIDELINLTIAYQQQGGHSLQGFLDWYERGEGVIKREGLAKSADVRILTVHGAKGLQAPVVILADCALDPLKIGNRNGGIDWTFDDDNRLPLLHIKKEAKHGRLEKISDQQQERELREHNRLLYVALTRAEEHLILAGALGKKVKDVPEHSWYALLTEAMALQGAIWQDIPHWGSHMLLQGSDVAKAQHNGQDKAAEPLPTKPDWLTRLAPIEARPPRPLAPSNLDDDDYGESPASSHLAKAAERGRLLHRLFERYDGRDPAAFSLFARDWLKRDVRVDGIDLDALAAQFSSVVGNPDWKQYFSANARGEVPLTAVVGETVITGRVDRLLVEDERVTVLDFKTGASVPTSPSAVPVAHLRQMAHYVAALESIFPSHRIEAALLFTHAPMLLPLSDADLAAYKPAIAA